MKKYILLLLIILLPLTGCDSEEEITTSLNVDVSDNQPSESESSEEVETLEIEPDDTSEVTEADESEEDSADENGAAVVDTEEEIRIESLEAAIQSAHSMDKNEALTIKPADFERFAYPGNDEPYDASLDGVSSTTYVLIDSALREAGYMDDVLPFYIEIISPPTCYMEADCNDPELTTYHGPFEGELRRFFE